MITIVRGDIWTTTKPNIVVPVNCVGVMGAGLARQCVERYPETLQVLKDAALVPGDVTMLLEGAPHNIIAAATKNHWRNPSRLSWVRDCLEVLSAYGDLALPMLGAGLGGLDGRAVENLIREILGPDEGQHTLYVR